MALQLLKTKARKWRRNMTACLLEYDYVYDQEEPVIVVNTQAMILSSPVCGQLQTEGHSYQFVDRTMLSGEQGPVWQKNILMGGKCQLPDFSGVIIYDSEGNVVTPAKPTPLLTGSNSV